MISKNIMKTDEFENSVYYRAACSCGTNEHDVTIEFEIDKDPTILYLNFYKNINWASSWEDLNWFKIIWKRIKCSFRVFFTGYIELEESFIIRGEDDIDDFIDALIEGKKYLQHTPNKSVQADKAAFDELNELEK